jgi:hypothetical protein
MLAQCLGVIAALCVTDVCINPEWFVYTILQSKPANTMAERVSDEIKTASMKLVSPVWQQQSQQLQQQQQELQQQQQHQQQQQLALLPNASNDASITANTTVPLELDMTSLATVLKVACTTEAHRTAALSCLKYYSNFISYGALVDIHSTQPLLHDTQGKHIIDVSSELICTSVWHKDAVKDTIGECGYCLPVTSSTTAPLSNDWLTAIAVVPVHASVSLDVLSSATELADHENKADVFASDVIGAIVELHWGLHAQDYWNKKAALWYALTLPLLYYVFYIGSTYYNSITQYFKLWHELIEVIVTWCILTKAAVYKLDRQVLHDAYLMRRAVCLFVFYGWALVSTVILASARVQSNSSSIDITTITAVVLVVLSLLNQLQGFKQAATWCTSKLYHRIPLIRAWTATGVIAYIACSEVLAVLVLKPTAIAKYRQAICYWLMHNDCSSYSSEQVEVASIVSFFISCIMVSILGLPVISMIGWLVYDLAFEYWSVCANIVTHKCTEKSRLWRQQQAYMILSSYREGSAIKRKTIDAYLKKNC